MLSLRAAQNFAGSFVRDKAYRCGGLLQPRRSRSKDWMLILSLEKNKTHTYQSFLVQLSSLSCLFVFLPELLLEDETHPVELRLACRATKSRRGQAEACRFSCFSRDSHLRIQRAVQVRRPKQGCLVSVEVQSWSKWHPGQ